jgi:hypothetical protein
MEFMEDFGLTLILWDEGPILGSGQQTLVNKHLGSVHVIRDEAVLPDQACRGGLLCNERGTGKTYTSAALIAKRPAPKEWLEAADGTVIPDEEGAQAPLFTAAAAAPAPVYDYENTDDSESEVSDLDEDDVYCAQRGPGAAAPPVPDPGGVYRVKLSFHSGARLLETTADLKVDAPQAMTAYGSDWPNASASGRPAAETSVHASAPPAAAARVGRDTYAVAAPAASTRARDASRPMGSM